MPTTRSGRSSIPAYPPSPSPVLNEVLHPSGYSSDDEVEESLEQERSLSPRVATGPPQLSGRSNNEVVISPSRESTLTPLPSLYEPSLIGNDGPVNASATRTPRTRRKIDKFVIIWQGSGTKGGRRSSADSSITSVTRSTGPANAQSLKPKPCRLKCRAKASKLGAKQSDLRQPRRCRRSA